MSSISELKSKRKASFSKLTEKLEEMTNSKYSNPDDDKYWQCKRDNAGNGFAVIRFLPAPPDEDDEFVRLWSHGFKGPTGRWYIENCLSTLGKDDPVNKYNNMLWNTGDEEKRKQVSKQKRRLHFISNILVVKDPANPENEGKVFLFKYGVKIFDKIKEAMTPDFEGDVVFDPFDFWDGANFNLVIRKYEGFPNYDRAKFGDQSSVSDDDEELDRIWKSEYSLKEIIHESKFKSYAELEKQLNAVLGLDGGGNAGPVASAESSGGIDFSAMLDEAESKVEKETVSTEEDIGDSIPFSGDDDADEDLAFFKDLAND